MRVECEADRRRLAMVDNSQHLRDLTEAANRANVSFYSFYAPEATVPPQGMSRAVPEIDHAAARADSLRLLADGTDGLAVLKRTAVDEALPRIVADESSYYLVTYRSSNTKLDGRFRTLSARVTRPGVQMRTRRGYRGLDDRRAAERAPATGAARAAAAIPVAAPDARRPFRIRTSSWTAPDGGTFWIVGELDYRTRQELEWTAGATADVMVLAPTARELLSQTLTVKPARVRLRCACPSAGRCSRASTPCRCSCGPDANDSVVLTDTARVVMTAPRGDDLGTPVVWRRGPSTGPRHVQTADARFSRSERIRLELATTVPGTAAARLLDRAGQPLQVPVQVSARPDESGQFRWIVADAVLAPLAPGQYAIEVTLGVAAPDVRADAGAVEASLRSAGLGR